MLLRMRLTVILIKSFIETGFDVSVFTFGTMMGINIRPLETFSLLLNLTLLKQQNFYGFLNRKDVYASLIRNLEYCAIKAT